MDESSEHKIPNKTFLSAQKHAEEIADHGQAAERIGQTIGTDTGNAIAEHGRAIQEQINRGQADLHQLQQKYSTETYCKVARDHAQATQAHIEANRVFLRTFKSRWSPGSSRRVDESN